MTAPAPAADRPGHPHRTDQEDAVPETTGPTEPHFNPTHTAKRGIPLVHFNPFKPASPPEPVLLAVTPPRTGERTLLAVENLLASIAVPEPFSLELCGDADGVTLMARCLDQQVVRQQLSARYPQARVDRLEPAGDPLRLDESERAFAITLRASGPEYVPLRVFGDDDLLDAGSDPLLAILGALSDVRAGERVIARLRLRSLGPDWSQGHQARGHQPAIKDRTDSYHISESRRHRVEITGAALLALGAAGLLQGYRWWQAGEEWKTVALGAGVALTLGVAGWAWARWQRSRNRVYDPLLIREKVSRVAFEADIEVVAIVPGTKEDEGRERAGALLGEVAAAYRNYDHPAGARFRVSPVRPALPDPAALHPSGPGLLGARSVLGVREAASLWHPPGAKDETPLVERSGARVLLPPASGVAGGALVGETTSGDPRPIHFSHDLTRRHHLYVARTRMGKSTLMQHLVTHRLEEKAAGRDVDAIVVVDPHADLVDSILEHVPESLVEQVRLVDLAGSGGYPGINLLDSRVFTDRDRTADSVVRIAKGLWDPWGPRMQSILEQTVKTLHEANEGRDAGEQYTILDGLRILADTDFRADVLAEVNDPYLVEWWGRDFFGWRHETRADALAPVQTRLSYYASSKRARAILGQSRSTIDMRRVIREGGILFVSTAQGKAGRDVAALVGASLLNLVDAVIREQGNLPFEQRRGALVVVDEMQSMPGVDYESMLSELGKFGGSFVLATQSLAKLDDLSRTMRDTILANVGCLAVFQVAGSDARQLVWELGKDRVAEEDIVSLPVHQCYVRATVGTERMPAFSMTVSKPEDGDPGVAERIKALASSYLTTDEEIAAQQAEAERRAEEYREAANEARKARAAQSGEKDEKKDAPKDLGREDVRSKHYQPPTGKSAGDADDGEDKEEAQDAQDRESEE